MKKFASIGLLACFIFLINSCVQDEYPEILIDSNAANVVEIVSPCAYNDSAEVRDEQGMKGRVRGDYTDHFDYDDLILRFYSSANTVNIIYNDKRGFKNIKSQVVDFETVGSRIKMTVSFWDGTSRSMKAVQGKLYIVVRKDGSVKFDWCDVIFEETRYNYYTRSHGGYLLTF